MLSESKINEYKSRLETERAKLLAGIRPEDSHENFYQADVVTPEEESDETEQYADQLALEQTHKDRINEIDMALNKIKTGEYGICENCGRGISEKVLDIVPESQYCEDCKKEM